MFIGSKGQYAAGCHLIDSVIRWVHGFEANNFIASLVCSRQSFLKCLMACFVLCINCVLLLVVRKKVGQRRCTQLDGSS